MTFRGKTAWVTGASSGLGESLAKELARQGAAVILSGRRIDELNRVAKEIAGDTFVLPFETTDYAALPAAVKSAWAWRAGIDLLINNAGIGQRGLALETQFDVYRQLMEVDFFAPLRLTQLLLPAMVERRSGRIAVISSVAGKVGVPMRSGYSAAKHACLGYFDALRAEVEETYGIGVSVVVAGTITTGISANALMANGSASGRLEPAVEGAFTPDAAAAAIVEQLAAGAREIWLAEGVELGALKLRAADPETLFRLAAQHGAQLAASQRSHKGLG
jgi:dehydrogenase/reductase SDR family member 7B